MRRRQKELRVERSTSSPCELTRRELIGKVRNGTREGFITSRVMGSGRVDLYPVFQSCRLSGFHSYLFRYPGCGVT